jgi:hypothetical protein
MKFTMTKHASQEMERRSIQNSLVESVLDNPEQVVPEGEGLRAYQSRLYFGGKLYLVRVIVNDEVDPARVVTVYRTSKVHKYWRLQ